MKNTFWKTVGASLAILLLTIFAQVQVSAQNTKTEDQSKEQTQENSTEQSGGERLGGTWDSQVTLRNCQTGAAIRTFASITTFAQGGTVLDTTSGVPQALRTPGQGVWSHVSGETYRFKFKAFNFDPSGNSTGWTIIKHVAHLNRSADEFESAGTSEVYDPLGNLIFTGCSSTTAVRFE